MTDDPEVLDPVNKDQPHTVDLRLIIDRDVFIKATRELPARKVSDYLGIVVGNAILQIEIEDDTWKKLREMGILSKVRSI